jgi:hypothetical protein
MHQITLANENIKQYQTYIDYAKLVDQLRDNCSEKGTVDSNAFIQYLNHQVEEIHRNLREKEY